jgi:FkbM family methyltransferase
MSSNGHAADAPMPGLGTRLAKRAFVAANLEVRRLGHSRNWGWDAMADIARHVTLVNRQAQPVLFDVGANAGQTVRNFRSVFPDPLIHCFEPGPAAFTFLKKHTAGVPGLTYNNFALGAEDGEMELLEMADGRADMNSFLEPGADADISVQSRCPVRVRTIDGYCKEQGIDQIDVLKSDTQGFDLEVIRGAERMIRERRIRLVYIELNFAAVYKGLPPVDVVLRHLRERGFDLVSFYKMYHVKNRAGWTDALFISDRSKIRHQ